MKLIFASVRVHVNFLTWQLWFVWPLWGVLLCEPAFTEHLPSAKDYHKNIKPLPDVVVHTRNPTARKQVLRQKEQRKSDVSLSHLTSARSGRNIVRYVSISKMKLLFWWNYPTVPPSFYKRAEKELSPWFSTCGSWPLWNHWETQVCLAIHKVAKL